MSEQHQNLIRTIEKQRDRIEALEAALREIAGQTLIDEHDEDYNGDYEAGYEAIIRIARAALPLKCVCAVTCQDLGVQGGCRYIRPIAEEQDR